MPPFLAITALSFQSVIPFCPGPVVTTFRYEPERPAALGSGARHERNGEDELSVFLWKQYSGAAAVGLGDDPDSGILLRSVHAEDAETLSHRPLVLPAVVLAEITPIASGMPIEIFIRHLHGVVERIDCTRGNDDISKTE
jgi:hypothetical protein